MSGICGIFNLRGAPIDRTLLEKMTASLAFRGPDAQQVWADGPVGFGHTLLRTTFESEHEKQPCTLDGQVWISADARIDGRDELKTRLAAHGRGRIGKVTDAELILHAYHAWAENCVQHLIGDFAFALWDGPRRRLFCARDHFGVKPFFYARVGECLVFSNTLECVRMHPAVSTTLNDLAIADFLLFDSNEDPEATAFADIRRLPPAQHLTCSGEGFATRVYWTLPECDTVHYRSAGDYVERFSELLRTAVADRLRTRTLSVEMSGGMDSTSVAAIAKDLLAQTSCGFELQACTIVYDRLIPDQERHFAGLTARALGIPIHFLPADDDPLYAGYAGNERPSRRFPEPSHELGAATSYAALQAHAACGRVMLSGWDGDALLNESPKPYFRSLLKAGRVLRLLGGVAGYALSERRLLPHGLRARLSGASNASEEYESEFPAWLNPALEERLGLRARWHHFNRVAPANDSNIAKESLRPYACNTYAYLTRWSNFFDGYDSGVTRLPLECRHPLLDLRLIDFCLKLPPHPWCVKKRILRLAMRDQLPEPVRQRPKTPLAGQPEVELLQAPGAQWVDSFVPVKALSYYVDRQKIPAACGRNNPDASRDLRPLSLNFWLQNLQSK